MDVVFKEGILYLQGVKFGKKTWRRTWIVLFQPSASGVGRVELYNVREGPAYLQTKRRAERRVVRLCDCLSIVPAPEESCPPECTAFLLNTTKRTYTLASEACQDWMGALCLLAFQREPSGPDRTLQMPPMEDNDLYSSWKTAQYKVTVQSTEASRRCGLVGDYLLAPETDSLLLLDLQTGQTIYCWPYHLLRRFGCVKEGFSIEAGRRCHSGEGRFTFQSQHIPQIHRAMEEAIARQRLEQDAKPPPRTSTAPSETTASDCYQNNTGSLSNYPDRLSSPQQPSRGSPITCPLTEPEPEADGELYATIDHDPRLNCTHQELVSLIQRRNLHESSLGWDGEEGEEGRCPSLESFNLDDVREEPHYGNLTTWIKSQGAAERDSPRSDCAIVRNPQAQYQAQPQSQSQCQTQFQCQSQPQSQFTCNLMPQLQSPPKPKPQPPAKPKPQLQPLSQLNPRPQPQWGVETCQSEKPSPPAINPTEIPVSFKLKLTNILSKDLAKLQPPLPSAGSESPTFHHY